MLSEYTCRANKSKLIILYKQAKHVSSTNSTSPPKPHEISSDMIGPPDPVSNLRSIVFMKPKQETKLEKQYRSLREEVQVWNQDFWKRHNMRFFQEREDYLKKNLPEGKSNLTADEMSVFYKAFLDKNWESHINYNKEWYKKNFTLLTLAIQVKLRKFFRIKD